MADELNSSNNFTGLGWSYPCDVWSVGCILVELCTVYLLIFCSNVNMVVKD